MRLRRVKAAAALLCLAGQIQIQAQAQPLPAPPVSPAPVTNHEYDANGNRTRSVIAPGSSGFAFATSHSFDTLDRRKDSTDARAGITRFGYNGREDLNSVTDPRNLVTQYPRNGLGEATGLVSPDTGTATHSYDAAGKLETRTDSRGVLATYTHDALNRLTSVVYSQSGQTSLSHGYAYDQVGAGYANGVGRLTSTTHPAGSTQYSYDAQGRLLTDIQRVAAASGANAAQISTTVSYGYDTAGNVTSIVYPSGRKLAITYTDGLPSAMTLAASALSTPVNLITQIQWEPFGGVRSWHWQLASGTQLHERLYDASGRVVRYRLGNTLRDLSYDAADRISAYTHYDVATATPTPALDQGFGYDELGRLTSVSAGGSSWLIAYDANGNRASVTLNGTARNYTTAPTSNRLTALDNPVRSMAHDAMGKRTSDQALYASSYDLAGRLATLSAAGTTTTYAVDGFGRRVRKFSSSGAASTVIFVYGQDGQLLGEYDRNGAPLREYVWLGATPIAVFVSRRNQPAAGVLHPRRPPGRAAPGAGQEQQPALALDGRALRHHACADQPGRVRGLHLQPAHARAVLRCGDFVVLQRFPGLRCFYWEVCAE